MKTVVDVSCGQKISDWTLQRPCGKRHWICKCKCGTEYRVDKYNLLNHSSKRCRSCASKTFKRKRFAEDLSGNSYHDWVVLSRNDGDFTEPYWNCQCKCGFVNIVSGSSLKRAKSKRCKCCSRKNRTRKNNLIDLTGRTFGKWIVLNRAKSRYGSRPYWACKCECGREKEVCGQTLTQGKSTSCTQCMRRPGNRTHGHTVGGKSAEYHIWNSIKNRCYNINDKGYQNYGKRGIKMHPTWRTSFSEFLAYIGPKPFPKASVDRIDNDKGYVPGNVRWADSSQQMGNTRRQKYGVCIKHWSKANNLDRHQVSLVLRSGVPLDKVSRYVSKPYREC